MNATLARTVGDASFAVLLVRLFASRRALAAYLVLLQVYPTRITVRSARGLKKTGTAARRSSTWVLAVRICSMNAVV
jgi:hypothetical protein